MLVMYSLHPSYALCPLCAVHNVHLAYLQDYVDRLLHVVPNQNYDWYHRHFASAYVQDRLAECYIRSRGIELQTPLLYAPIPEHRTIFGHLFDFYCLAKLAEGGSFPMRSLDEPGKLCMPVHHSSILDSWSSPHIATAICRSASARPSACTQQPLRVQQHCEDARQVRAVPAVS